MMMIAPILCKHLNATAIALIVTPKFVVVATDSKVVDGHLVARNQECKIRTTGETFYVPNKFVRNSVTG